MRKYSRFDTLATTQCDQQDALDEAHRRYDELVQSTSARITQLTRNHEASLEKEVRQAAAQASVATERLQASEAQAQLRLQEHAQTSATMIAELRKALKETSDQALVNSRTTAEVETTRGPTSPHRAGAGMGDVHCKA